MWPAEQFLIIFFHFWIRFFSFFRRKGSSPSTRRRGSSLRALPLCGISDRVCVLLFPSPFPCPLLSFVKFLRRYTVEKTLAVEPERSRLQIKGSAAGWNRRTEYKWDRKGAVKTIELSKKYTEWMRQENKWRGKRETKRKRKRDWNFISTAGNKKHNRIRKT